MQFDYEIPADEYAAAQVLYYKACSNANFVKEALAWASFGLLCILMAILDKASDWIPILLFFAGLSLIYGGIAPLFATRKYRKFYPESGLAGKAFHAEVDDDGLAVSGNDCTWRVLWAEVRFKGEDERVFMFAGKGTMFIFGKKFLTDNLQSQIRQFAANH
jgi:hypothetical protein